jgi:group II intron reverse transcriptase/maturase
VADRIAQQVVKQRIEPRLEQQFHPNSYGYRPNKSALDAIAVARQRCWKRAWVLDMDIKGFFDEINHELLMLAVTKHVKEKWIICYIKRWLTAPVQYRDGQQEQRSKGTPQGGVISPLLANLYLHYVFDKWVEKHWNGVQFERYAGDIVCHCHSEQEAKALKALLEQRFNDCHLTLHPKKTKIAYCKSSNNSADYPMVSFDFLGHTFKPRLCKNKQGIFFVTFTPAISTKSAKKVRDKITNWSILKNNQLNLEMIAKFSRPVLQGWINYYGRYGRAELKRVLFYFNECLIRWAKRKYKRLKKKAKATRWFIQYRHAKPQLFVHWNLT